MITIKIEGIPEKLGGGYRAYCLEYGKWGYCGDGDTPYQALYNFIHRPTIHDFFKYILKQNKQTNKQNIKQFKK